MKKFLSTILVLLSFAQTTFAFSADTTGWAENPEHINVSASEIDLKSDLKNDFKVYQTTLTNVTQSTIDVSIPTNKTADNEVDKILKSGLSFKELMVVPKQIAVDSYNEDVGTGKVAKAHKGLIYILATAGTVAAGAGLLGIYPQQKTEEYFANRKIKKEYNKITGELNDEFTLAPLEQKDVLILVPIDNTETVIYTHSRGDVDDVYSDYHQL